jgi:hypothetical protein
MSHQLNSPENLVPSRIPVAFLILGYKNNQETLVNIIRGASSMVCTVIDEVQAVVNTRIEWIPREILDARRRGVRFLTITDITKQNLSHCKQIMARIDELRHLDGIGVNFVVTDAESVVMAPTFGPRDEVSMQVIHSDSESIVEYKRTCFDFLWNKAMPAHARMTELSRPRVSGPEDVRGKRFMIERIFTCAECNQCFLDLDELHEHWRRTDHKGFREYPIN